MASAEVGWEKLLGAAFKDTALTGILTIDKVRDRSAATRAFASYPLKFLVPTKLARNGVDVVWVFAITYGGGIVHGDSISQRVQVAKDCSAVLTTQSSTKIFKSVKGKACEQLLQAHVAQGGFLAVLPDPITCFKDSKYNQVQEFYLAADANLVLIDWMTSGRIDNGESWEFFSYKSANHIYLGEEEPLLLDCLSLERESVALSLPERMRGFHVVANMVAYGPRLAAFRAAVTKNVVALTQGAFSRRRSAELTAHLRDEGSRSQPSLLFVSCSNIGVGDEGLVVRAVGSSTEAMYDFFRAQLALIAQDIGACPYAGR